MRRILADLVALAVGLILVAAMWRVPEKVFHRLNAINDARITFEGNYYTDYLRYDGTVGPKGAPNVHVRSVKKVDGQVVYNAVYTTDACGRRLTCDPTLEAPHDRFLAFFGCSYTFGEGLADEETLPCQAAQLARSYRVYN